MPIIILGKIKKTNFNTIEALFNTMHRLAVHAPYQGCAARLGGEGLARSYGARHLEAVLMAACLQLRRAPQQPWPWRNTERQSVGPAWNDAPALTGPRCILGCPAACRTPRVRWGAPRGWR